MFKGRALHFSNVYNSVTEKEQRELRRFTCNLAETFGKEVYPGCKGLDELMQEQHKHNLSSVISWGRGNAYSTLAEEISEDEESYQVDGKILLGFDSNEAEENSGINNDTGGLRSLKEHELRSENNPIGLFADTIHNFYLINEISKYNWLLNKLRSSGRRLSEVEKTRRNAILAFGAAAAKGSTLDRNLRSLDAIQVAQNWASKDSQFEADGQFFYKAGTKLCGNGLKNMQQQIASFELMSKNTRQKFHGQNHKEKVS